MDRRGAPFIDPSGDKLAPTACNEYLCPPLMTATLIRICLALAFIAPVAALAARADWSAADRSQLRLLLSAPANGKLAGGIEILLEPGWYTYWRNPGESGVPPVFDFSGSDNVADIEVLYPVPQRYDDGASVSLIYRDEVVFPLSVMPVAPGKPVTLRVAASFGVCREVCIPTEASSTVALPTPAVPDPLTGARLARYLALVPRAAEAGHFDVEDVVVENDALLIDVRMPDSVYADLFSEAPAGWFIGQPAFVARADGVSRFRLPLAGRPRDASIAGQIFRFVAVSGGEAIEKEVEIR